MNKDGLSEEGGDRTDGAICPVCRDDLGKEKIPVRYDCGCSAIFCAECTVRWIGMQKRECPCCKQNVQLYVPRGCADLWNLEFLAKEKVVVQVDLRDCLLRCRPVARSRVTVSWR